MTSKDMWLPCIRPAKDQCNQNPQMIQERLNKYYFYQRTYWQLVVYRGRRVSFLQGCGPSEDGHDQWRSYTLGSSKWTQCFVLFNIYRFGRGKNRHNGGKLEARERGLVWSKCIIYTYVWNSQLKINWKNKLRNFSHYCYQKLKWFCLVFMHLQGIFGMH